MVVYGYSALALTMHILFDTYCGSQRGYISERAKETLGLFPKRREKLLVKTIGKVNEEIKKCGIVEFYVKGLSQCLGFKMTVLTVPLIRIPLTNQAVQFARQLYGHLADLTLADQPSEDRGSELNSTIPIDLSSLETRNWGNQDVWAMKTRLGWVLSGPMPHSSGSDTDFRLFTSHTLRLYTPSCDDLLPTRKFKTRRWNKSWEFEAIGVST